ncbi:SlyX family protein [Ketobacter alkanivorans]|uniref:SlyX protein n=1 Tax=Ketobacter alkanivorans TaxID=1917421 RepID=A0A2K9LMD6_9GAMM|nr:SlyX family protein [Ketobacter alkanivorans]AUM13498.1 SlyX protein [Ketobacter alkanivorans]MCP5018139.1 SlyX family protein [Ketobacter sp.]
MEEKIVNIETRLAFQDDTIQELSDVIYRQQQQIDQLEKTLQALLNKVQDLMEGGNEKIVDERPPHY